MRRIMIIDDDTILLQTLEIFLKQHYDVVTFSNVDFAISYLEDSDNKVDLIFLDIRMPEISGIMAFDMIKQSENGNTIPIVFLSGLSDKRTVVECIEMGASNYLLKPVNMDLLIDTIETTLGTAGVPVVTSEKPVLLLVARRPEIKNLAQVLGREYYVVTVPSVIPAVEFLKKNKAAVILVDYELPVYNGVQTVAKVKELALDSNFGTVIAYKELDGEKRVEALNVDALCIQEPIDEKELFERLEEAFEMNNY